MEWIDGADGCNKWMGLHQLNKTPTKWDKKLWERLDAGINYITSDEVLIDPYKYDIIALNNKKDREKRVMELDPTLLETPVIQLTLADCIMLRKYFDTHRTNGVLVKDKTNMLDLMVLVEDVCYAAESGELFVGETEE